jgi:hypothetical protein
VFPAKNQVKIFSHEQTGCKTDVPVFCLPGMESVLQAGADVLQAEGGIPQAEAAVPQAGVAVPRERLLKILTN